MAISAPHYEALNELSTRDEFMPNSRILEIGEANFYGDKPLQEVRDDIAAIGDDLQREKCERRFSAIDDWNGKEWRDWKIAKLIYDIFINPSEVLSIDLHGTPAAQKMDLNRAMKVPEPFDVVYNHGTAEHIFNIANVFEVMHNACKVDGLMIHESPWTGWPDHGFWSIQPTTYYDLSAVNGYDIRYMAIEHIGDKMLREVKTREEIHELVKLELVPNNAMLFVAMRKTTAEEFKIPMQGFYARNVSEEVQTAWRALR